MDSSPNSVQQQYVLDLIYDNELEKLMDFVPTLPTLNFLDPEKSLTPLCLAVGGSEEEVIEYLLLEDADPNFPSRQTLPLLVAIERSIEADKYFADSGDPSREEDPLSIIELLLRYGADYNKQDPMGRTAYEYAVKVHHPSWRLFERLSLEAMQNPE